MSELGKKGHSPKVYGYFDVKDGKASRNHNICSRCGKGVFMAQHKDRRSCGRCGLTEFL